MRGVKGGRLGVYTVGCVDVGIGAKGILRNDE